MDALCNAVRIVRESRADAIKVEGGLQVIENIPKHTAAIAYVRLRPQCQVVPSDHRAQEGHGESVPEETGVSAVRVVEEASYLLSMYILQELSRDMTIEIPTGVGTHWQGLAWDDMLGSVTWHGHQRKFVRRLVQVDREVKLSSV